MEHSKLKHKMNNKIYMFDADGVVIQSQMFSYKYAREFNIKISELGNFQD